MAYKLANDLDQEPALPIGMIGGGRGSFFAPYHRAAMRLSGRWTLRAGAFSSDFAKSLDAARALGVDPGRVYRTAGDLAREEASRPDGVKAVVVVTPNYLHYEACKTLIEAGLGVICDKPLVNTLAEAKTLRRMARERGVFFGMTYSYCGFPMVREVRQLVSQGEVGELRFVYVEYLQEWLADDPKNLGGKAGAWRIDPAQAGPTGTLGDIGTHAFNLAEYVTGATIESVSANMRTLVQGRQLDDNDIVQLQFAGGPTGLMWVSQAMPGHRNGLRIKVVGTKGAIEWRQEAPETLTLGALGQPDRILYRGQRTMTAVGQTQVTLPAGNPEGYHEALAVLYSDFADQIAPPGGGPSPFPYPGVEEGMRGIAFCDAALRSSHAGGTWVALDVGEFH